MKTDNINTSKKFSPKFSRGFTVVEALVAIGILTLSIGATFSAVTNGLRSSILAKDRITAFYLAQEAFEFIRYTRDNNALANLDGTPTNWLYNLASGDPDTDNCPFGSACIVDVISGTALICPGANQPTTCPPLRQEPATSRFGYGKASWPVTRFTRAVQLTSITPDEVNVKVTMLWTSDGMPVSFVVTENLFNHD